MNSNTDLLLLNFNIRSIGANFDTFNCFTNLLNKKFYILSFSDVNSLTLVSEFGRVCERRKLRVNVDKSKVMRCSRYGNADRMHVILNGEPLEEVDCFKYLGSQVVADGGC